MFYGKLRFPILIFRITVLQIYFDSWKFSPSSKDSRKNETKTCNEICIGLIIKCFIHKSSKNIWILVIVINFDFALKNEKKNFSGFVCTRS